MRIRTAPAGNGDRSAVVPPGGPEGWRSHTFADGVRAITVTGPLDVDMPRRLAARLEELAAQGCRRLIVDVTPVGRAGISPTLLGSAFDAVPPSCETIVVVSPASPLGGMLPRWIGLARSLGDARRQLAAGTSARRRRARPVPAEGLSDEVRSVLQVRQSQRWAGGRTGAPQARHG